DKAFVRGRPDGAVEVKLLVGALARKAAESPERQLDVARSKLRIAVEILELAFVPDFDRATAPALVLADAHALGMVAIGAERGRPAGSNPFRAALMAPRLLGEALAQRLHQLVEAELFDFRALFGAQILFRQPA